METILTFDVAHAARLRDALNVAGFKEGRDYRIGMGEKPYQMTLRANPLCAIAPLVGETARKVLPKA